MEYNFRSKNQPLSGSNNLLRFYFLIVVVLLSLQFNLLSSQTYQLNKTTDIAIGSGIIGLGLIDLKLQQDLSILSETDISKLQSDQVWKLDRFATKLRSLQADQWSDRTHYASMALPLLLLVGPDFKSDLPIVGIMLIEAVGLNAGLTILTKNLVKRERPFTYNPTVRLSDKQVKSGRQSYFSGHASNAATLGFFTAKVFSDLHPESRWRPLMWAVGAGLPAVVSGLRVGAGKHFLTDVVSGYTVGALIGYLIPQSHKRSQSSRIQIGSGVNGMLSLRIALNK